MDVSIDGVTSYLIWVVGSLVGWALMMFVIELGRLATSTFRWKTMRRGR